MKENKEWFQNWFDTKYYHILYDHRNDDEAHFFMQNLLNLLQLKKGSHILDLPCGKGRHAIFLNDQGFNVKAGDLSVNSIAHARAFENETLKFFVHDMRNPLSKKYDAIFNLFTSFGYFDQDVVNLKVLKNFKAALQPHGKIIIDFLNIDKIKANLVPQQKINKRGIIFHIEKSIENEILTKNIRFTAEGDTHFYTEKVQCLTLEKMTMFTEKVGLNIVNIFGDYHLNPFDSQNSDRLILILE